MPGEDLEYLREQTRRELQKLKQRAEAQERDSARAMSSGHRRIRDTIYGRRATGGRDTALMLLAIYDLLDERLPVPPMPVIGEKQPPMEDDPSRAFVVSDED